MKTLNRHGESVRGFELLVHRKHKPILIYPVMTGQKTLECMRILKNRGFNVEARTSGFGEDNFELLSLQDMSEVYNDFPE